MARKEPLYPHVPKSKTVETPHRVEETHPAGLAPTWSPTQKFLYYLQTSITDEMDGYHSYQRMASLAIVLGEKEWAVTLEQMANDEYRHHDRLMEILKHVEIAPQTRNRVGGKNA